jgi:23S rRNA (uridine2552-2'-O)-methyltransferase
VARRPYNPKDPYYHRAKREHFVARSVYKLEEIDQRHGVLKKGARVVDFGCSPGSWIQYAGEVVGAGGLVLGYDIEPVRASGGPHVKTFVADVH